MKTALACFALAVAWTWPAVVTPGLYGQQPDALGTAWFIDAAPRLVTSLHDAQTGWPAGVTYGRPDSFVLMAMSLLVPWMEPARVHALVGVVGLAVSGWAAEGFARAAGARSPWSLLAAVGFVFGGLASTALLEGYVYHLFDPWLPLLGWAWLRATTRGTAWHGVAAGVAFVLAVLTTAWLGLAAAILVVGLGIGALVRGTLSVRPLVGAATIVIPSMSLYVAAFLAAGDNADQNLSLASTPLQDVTLSLVRFTGPMLSTDVSGHNQTANVPAVVLALFAAAPLVLRRRPGWRSLAATGVVALVLSLAPRVDPATWAVLVPDAFARFVALLAESVLRFPERIGWATALCAGVVAARVATELHRRVGWLAFGVAPLALIDVFGVQRLQDRQRLSPIEVPSAYAGGSGAVLDLWPEDVSPAPSWTLLTTNTGCYYQVGHGRPIADHCIFVGGEASPRLRLGAWTVDRLLTGDVTAGAALGRLGFGTLAVHVDSFRAEDRSRLLATLAGIDPSPTRSTDGGEAIVAFDLPLSFGTDPSTEWAQWSF